MNSMYGVFFMLMPCSMVSATIVDARVVQPQKQGRQCHIKFIAEFLPECQKENESGRIVISTQCIYEKREWFTSDDKFDLNKVTDDFTSSVLHESYLKQVIESAKKCAEKVNAINGNRLMRSRKIDDCFSHEMMDPASIWVKAFGCHPMSKELDP